MKISISTEALKRALESATVLEFSRVTLELDGEFMLVRGLMAGSELRVMVPAQIIESR